jgi:hypothetical protein
LYQIIPNFLDGKQAMLVEFLTEKQMKIVQKISLSPTPKFLSRQIEGWLRAKERIKSCVAALQFFNKLCCSVVIESL